MRESFNDKKLHRITDQAIKRGPGAANIDMLINKGMQPYVALAFSLGFDVVRLADLMGMSVERVQKSLRGTHDFQSEHVLTLCDLAGYPPHLLHPATNRDPAPGAIVEATVLRMESMVTECVPNSMINFLKEEMAKADRLSAVTLNSTLPDNREMLCRAQALMVGSADGRFYDFGYERTDPIAHILSDLSDAVKYTASGAWIPEAAQGWIVREKRAAYMDYRRRMFDAACAVAPGDEPADWLSAFNDQVDVLGFELAAEMVKENPAVFYPVGRYDADDFSMIVHGEYIKGKRVVDVFCDSYRRAKDMGKWIATEENNYERNDYYCKIADSMKVWFEARTSKHFLQAEANCRFIVGRLDIEDLTLHPVSEPQPANPTMQTAIWAHRHTHG